MDYPCKPCGGTIAPSELVLPVPLDPVHIVAVDLGKVYTCSDCGKTFVVWSQRNLAFKTSMAAFSFWFGLMLLGTGLFAITVIFNIPDLFGFQGRGVGEASTAFWVAAIVGWGGAFLAFSAYIPDVVRQWILRSRLRGRIE